MKKKISLHVIIILVVISGCAVKKPTSTYNDYLQSKGFNGQVYISQRGKPIYQKTFGYADMENKKAIQPNDSYLIGSITKQFTGLCILLLEEKGLLSTRDSVGKYFPAFPGQWRRATVHELLTHSSGLPDYEDFTKSPGAMFYNVDSLTTAFSKYNIPFFERGKFRYSNVAYLLLSGIIEKASGKPYCQFLNEYILTPLQMSNTGCISDGMPLSTTGYEKGSDEKFKKLPFAVNDFSVGAGNLYSTKDDLVKWNNAIRAGKIISTSILSKWFGNYVLVEVQSEYEDKGDYTGYGWFVSMRGKMLYKTYHLGGVTGYKTSITRFTDKDLLILTLSNVEDKYANQIRMEFPKLVYKEEK